MVVLAAERPSRLQARVLAALATRRMFLGESDTALPLAVRAVSVAQQTDADAEHAHALATLGIIKAQHGDLDAGLADLRTSFGLAYRSRSIEDVLRVAAFGGRGMAVAGQPYREAYARWREAEAAVRAGRRDQATRALAACEDLARRAPSAPLLTLAEALARRARLTRRERRSPPRAPASSAAASARFDLTDRETEVLALLIKGDSNRQIARSLVHQRPHGRRARFPHSRQARRAQPHRSRNGGPPPRPSRQLRGRIGSTDVHQPPDRS